MHDAGLDLGGRIDRLDRFGEAAQTVDHRDQENLSAFLWARRLNSALSARLHKSLAEQDSKLVHR